MANTVAFEKKATTLGTYWRSPKGKRELFSVLRAATEHSGWEKDAAIGGEQEQGFEQAFASLAYTYLKDKSPRLLDYIVGFQLVDRNNDNTKAIGVFGFKVGDQWLYAPVFFLNGDLKGHELLYIKKQDTFVPLKENWVNYLISRRPHVLGSGSDQNAYQLGGGQPNLARIIRPPLSSKYGAANEKCSKCGVAHNPGECAAGHKKRVDGWALDFMPVAAATATKKAAVLYPNVRNENIHRGCGLEFSSVVANPFKAALAETAEALDLSNVLTTLPLLKTAYEKCYQQYPLIKIGFDKFYGKDFFANSLLALREKLVKTSASYILPPKPVRKKKVKTPINSLSIMADELEETDKNAGLVVIALDDEAPGGFVGDDGKELTDAERAKLLRDTVLIKDKRDPHAVSMAYNTQVRMELTNPDETGIYSVLERPGSFDDMLIVSNPHTGRGREDFVLLVRKSDPRNWKNAARTNIWTQQNERHDTPDDFKEWVNGLDGTDSLQVGGTYLALGASGSGTCPFRVRQDYGDGTYKVEWYDSISWTDRPARSSALSYARSDDLWYSSFDAKLSLNRRKGSKLRSVNGELFLPEDFKILKLKDPPKPKDDSLLSSCCEEPGESDKAPIEPGNIGDVQIAISKQAHPLRVLDTGGDEIHIRADGKQYERMSKKAALLHLIRDHGLREHQAREIIKQAATCAVAKRPAEFLVKYAIGFGPPWMTRDGPNAPSFPEPQTGFEQAGAGSVSSIYPQEDYVPVDAMSAYNTDPSTYDPYYQPDQQAMQVAQQAAASGQKEVFDTAMVSGMLKSVRKDSLVDRHLGDLMKAVNSLGRILLLFYWHNEEFEDRYGKHDMPELEDSIRNAFEALGDVTLFLKEKTVGAGANDVAGSGVGNPEEPSVNEVARN